MRDIQREIADKYQEFFNFMNQEHNLILTIEQMDEIVFEAQKLVKKLTIPAVVGRSEQFYCKDESYHKIERCTKQCSDCLDFVNDLQ